VPHLGGGADQPGWIARLESEHANLLAAHDHCDDVPHGARDGLRLAAALWRFWHLRGHHGVGLGVLRRALDRPTGDGDSDARVRAEALTGAGWLAQVWDREQARAWSDAALTTWRALGDTDGAARALINLGTLATDAGDDATARRHYEEALAIHRTGGHARGMATCLNNLGAIARNALDFGAAIGWYEEALVAARAAGDRDILGLIGINLALARARSGQLAAASRAIREALAIVLELDARRAGTSALEVAAEIARALGREEEAVQLLAAAHRLRDDLGLQPDPRWRAIRASVDGAIGATLDPSRRARAWDEGWGMGFRDAVARALDVVRGSGV
jgi:tetratricopeptide (TPR) repeat protein